MGFDNHASNGGDRTAFFCCCFFFYLLAYIYVNGLYVGGGVISNDGFSSTGKGPGGVLATGSGYST